MIVSQCLRATYVLSHERALFCRFSSVFDQRTPCFEHDGQCSGEMWSSTVGYILGLY